MENLKEKIEDTLGKLEANNFSGRKKDELIKQCSGYLAEYELGKEFDDYLERLLRVVHR